jgi:putative ATPase
MKELGYGKDYMYSHDYPGNFVQQEFMPEELKDTSFYQAGSSKKEQEIQAIIQQLWGTKYH